MPLMGARRDYGERPVQRGMHALKSEMASRQTCRHATENGKYRHSGSSLGWSRKRRLTRPARAPAGRTAIRIEYVAARIVPAR
jgi:hypothetical protein